MLCLPFPSFELYEWLAEVAPSLPSADIFREAGAFQLSSYGHPTIFLLSHPNSSQNCDSNIDPDIQA